MVGHWSDCHCPPIEWSPWIPQSQERPKATRKNSLTSCYTLDAYTMSPCGIIDRRSPRDIFGAPSRLDARQEQCCIRR